MIRRLVRTLMLLTVGPLAALVFKRMLDDRRGEQRLASPVTHWPDVAVDDAAVDDAAVDDGVAGDGAAGEGAVIDLAVGDLAVIDVRAVEDAAVVERSPVAPGARTWVEPDDGACPPGHPVKVKERSALYHLPGMAAYGRTLPDRCYAAAEDAERDGFTRARR